MSEGEGDIAVVLSSEMIETIAQEYFNKVMFKQKVIIESSRPASDGYMFSVMFVKEIKVPQVVDRNRYVEHDVPGIDFAGNGVTNSVVNVRDGKGKFAKKERV